jgi:hypothetical protein
MVINYGEPDPAFNHAVTTFLPPLRRVHPIFLQPLISTGLQPGVADERAPSRFNGLADVPGENG